MTVHIGTVLIVYVALSAGLGIWVSRRVKSAEDFLVAGRRLPLSLTWATLLATWFGAGTMLTAADSVYAGGLQRAALEPLGSGVCLILAGFFLARPLWSMNLLTIADFFAHRFGRRAERLSAVLSIPTYLGWIAVQFVALAEILTLFFAIPREVGILLVATVGMGYTLLGGMWSVALTDALQLAFLILGLVVLGASVLIHVGAGDLGAGFARFTSELPPGFLEPVPTATIESFTSWIGVFMIAALGNLSAQDLLQRIFAARSATIAQRACWLAGGAYLLLGAIPVLLGLCARVLWPGEVMTAVVPALSQAVLTPTVLIAFTLALTSAVLSTIDSALLAPASLLAQNLLPTNLSPEHALTRNRIAVIVITLLALVVAFAGDSTTSLLENAYAVGLVTLFVPLLGGLYRRPRGGEAPAIAAMLVGASVWGAHLCCDAEHFFGRTLDPILVPIEIASVIAAILAFRLAERG